MADASFSDIPIFGQIFDQLSGGLGAKKNAAGNFQSSFTPYPGSSNLPLMPQQNYWKDGQFYMPGVNSQTPAMSSSLLERFPNLANVFGGQQPNTPPPGSPGLNPPAGGMTPPGTTPAPAPQNDKLSWLQKILSGFGMQNFDTSKLPPQLGGLLGSLPDNLKSKLQGSPVGGLLGGG